MTITAQADAENKGNVRIYGAKGIPAFTLRPGQSKELADVTVDQLAQLMAIAECDGDKINWTGVSV